MSNLEIRQKRLDKALNLQEADYVPCAAMGQCYPAFNAGYTMADIFYDFKKNADAIKRFVTQYQPDASSLGIDLAGQGDILELMELKTLAWPGEAANRVGDNSIHQFIEFPVLKNEDMALFNKDYTDWMLKKGYPGISKLLEPMAKWDFASQRVSYDFGSMAAMIGSEESRKMIKALWEIDDRKKIISANKDAFTKELESMGYPVPIRGGALTPFDSYSDFFRGTTEAMMDMFDNQETILRYCDQNLEHVYKSINAQAEANPGKWVFIPLHKGMDGFMSGDQYAKFYWPYLQKIILHIIDKGMVPYVFTEGPYNSRLEFLKDVPKGKVIYSFEEADPVAVKKALGDTACITGLFPMDLLHRGTVDQVKDECKRLIDILAPGGGYIFATGAEFDDAKPENVEAMFDTVRTYGKK